MSQSVPSMARILTARTFIIAGCLTLLVPIAQTSQANAESGFERPFNSTAAADGMRVTVSSAGLPLAQTPVDSGGPSAQTSLNNLGTSRGYAAFPNPGEFVYLLPGLAGGLLSLPVSLPGYPLAVSSDADTKPEAAQTAGPSHLSAKSDNKSSHASALTAGVSTGGTAGLLSAEASTAAESSSVTAHARSLTEAVTIGPLTLGRVISEAAATIEGDGGLQRSSTLRVSGATVGGTGVEFTPEGLLVAGNTQRIDQGSVNELLRTAGMTVTAFPAEETKGGIVAPVLEISQQATLPVLGPASITYRFGGAVASVTAEVAGDDSASGPANTVTPGERPSVTSPSGPQGATAEAAGENNRSMFGPSGENLPVSGAAGIGAPLTSPGAELALSDVGTDAEPTVTLTTEVGSSEAVSSAVGSGASVKRSSALGQRHLAASPASAESALGTSSLYIVLVAAGIAGLMAMQIMRRMGVKVT